MTLVLDSGALSLLAARSQRSAALYTALSTSEFWPPVVPTVVIIESLFGEPGRDANINRFLKSCVIRSSFDLRIARRAANLRRLARAGSVVDALVVAVAEPGGTVLTGDAADITALASNAEAVAVQLI